MTKIFWILPAIVAVIAGICLIPGGAAILLGLLDSRIGRAVIAAGAIFMMMLAVRRSGYRAGKSDALADVAKANADAVRRHQRIELDVADRTEAELRDRLRRWSR